MSPFQHFAQIEPDAGGWPLDGRARLRAVAAEREAFGWHAQRVDGNDIPALVQAFDTLAGAVIP